MFTEVGYNCKKKKKLKNYSSGGEEKNCTLSMQIMKRQLKSLN